jgi:hypothetical protein
MKLLRLAALASVCAACSLAGSGVASADPVNARGATQQIYICGGVPVTLTTLPNGASAAFTSSTSVGIAVGVTVVDTSTGETIFSSLKPGFAVNALTTTTCSITFDGEQLNVTAFFTPASG